ncbi:GcrA cell cycle regulator [Mesorhizobium ciceri]|uniref:GcrA cell cycle regulator n=1 Tax=Mesorhizobium TaxID=68287 RepID=UPI0007A94D47|nr:MULTISPECIES: GcrA cell cycle regulator [Mesorhizobium]AMY03720.1 GcrA cell cycle regulator [Mesorhizobium ciceri biovar biserrulae]ARP67777.1 GcrA cell cycle regulator [Mesorhizobium sp. WSM1497]
MASYSDAELHEIARWLKDGFSASRIAVAFSALRGSPVSRDAIIGIVHRNAMLGAIGFANGKGPPPRSRQAVGKRAGSKRASGASAKATPVVGKMEGVLAAKDIHAREVARPRRAHSFVREVGVLIADGVAYRLEAPTPPRAAIGRQPHGVAMRFIDCLFSRCRAPLDLTVEVDPDISIAEEGAPGSRPGADMLCCGMRTRALKSYCTYHQARFQRRVFVATG